jgi:Gas vesicle synthesis protein GvpO
MAEQRRSRSQNAGRSDGSSSGSGEARKNSNGGAANRRMSAREAVECVREEFPSLLGRPLESVLGVQHDDDNRWQVTVQVVELSRIPSSTDILGAYLVTLDEDGEVAGYQRRRRYNRSQADED